VLQRLGADLDDLRAQVADLEQQLTERAPAE
jgi:hypothetical protein